MSWKKWKGSLIGAGFAPFTGGLSLLGGAYYDLSKQQTASQNKANQNAVNQANAYDMYTWDLANKYNDPKAQMERLKSAGLNPNLVYGSGNVTGNTTGTAGSNGVASREAFSAMGAVQKGLPLLQGLANLRNTNSQNELLKYQQGQTEAQTAFARAKTRDLNNFLNGSGPTTYASRFQTSSTQEPSADPSVEETIVSLAPKAAQPAVRKALKPLVGGSRSISESLVDYFFPYHQPGSGYYDNKIKKILAKREHERYISGRMSKKEREAYINDYF